MQELIGIALRLAVMYVFALALVRLSGKRDIGELSPLDFITTLIIGDMFDDAFWGTTPLAHTLMGFSVVMLLHTLNAAASARWRWFDRWVSGSYPVTVIKGGKFQPEGMRRERTPKAEVLSSMHEQGEEKVSEIQTGNWEPEGHLSVIKKPDARPAQKQDLDRLKRLFK